MGKVNKIKGEDSIKISIINKTSIIFAAIILAFFIYVEILSELEIFNYIPQYGCNGDYYEFLALPGFVLIYPCAILGLYKLFNNVFLRSRNLIYRFLAGLFCLVIILLFIYTINGGNLITFLHLPPVTWCSW